MKGYFFVFSLSLILSATSSLWAQGFTNADRYFSPNLDGVKDFIEIPFTIKEENLQKWSITIAKKEGDVFKRVMSYSTTNPKEEQLSFRKFFSRIIAKDVPLKSPESYLWEGRDDQGKLVADGVYYFTISAVDKWGNDNRSPLIPIVVDIVAPESKMTLDYGIFSPNGDGRKEELPIAITSVKFAELDTWSLVVKDDQGNEVRHFISEKASAAIAWDGKGDDGKDLPQGRYTLLLAAQDLAGNISEVKEQQVFLVRDYEKIGLEVSQTIFSPNRDGYYDNISFETLLSSLQGMEKWSLEIKDGSGKLVKQFGDSPFNKVIFYEGLGDDGKVIPDGMYTSQLRAWFNSGNQPNSSPVSFRVDTQAPKIGIELKNKILNPNAASGGLKTLTVIQNFPAGEKNAYQASILKQNGDAVFRTTYDVGDSPPREFVWNAKDSAGKVLSGRYVYEFKAKDEVANISTVVSEPFQVIDDSITVSVEVDNSSLSPNGDGKMDKVTFTFKVNKQYLSILSQGELTIFNDRQKPVKVFPFTEFPTALVWDGKVDGSQKALPDGVYSYSFKARFQTMEEVDTTPEKIYLDTTPVEVDFSPHEKIFSPNGDGNKDQIYFSNNYRSSQILPDSDQFKVVIFKVEKDKQTVYRTKEWKGQFPGDLIWTGKDQVEQDSPQGIYQMRVDTVDHAQNAKSYLSEPFTLVRDMEKIDLEVSPKLVSSISEGRPNVFTLTPKFTSLDNLLEVEYSLSLTNERRISLGRRKDSQAVEVNLLDKAKTSPPQSGLYALQASAVFSSGNQPVSPVREIFIDNDYPIASVNTQPLFFSPDGDGVNDDLSVRIISEDNSLVKRVTAAIFRKEEQKGKSPQDNLKLYYQKQIPLKTWDWDFNSKKFDNQFIWNGKGDLGDLVESATEYTLFVTVQDGVGLSATFQHEFLVDILVERLPDGRLKIILKSINFKYNSDEMVGNYERVLELLVRMLRKFPEYKIHVVGHTDSRGSDAYNDNLSVNRALRVLSYLVKQGGLAKERLTHEGMGKRELLIPEEKNVDSQLTGEAREMTIEENYRRNRRVEFFLKKEEK